LYQGNLAFFQPLIQRSVLRGLASGCIDAVISELNDIVSSGVGT
jgi:hypothetical protein